MTFLKEDILLNVNLSCKSSRSNVHGPNIKYDTGSRRNTLLHEHNKVIIQMSKVMLTLDNIGLTLEDILLELYDLSCIEHLYIYIYIH